MSSMLFSCPPPKTEKNCIFRGIGPCRDQVSHLICNAHAELFGLTYATCSYVNGNNDTWTKINTYVSSTTSLYIPLFIDNQNTLLVNEIRSFCINAANLYSVRVEELEQRIGCIMGVNLYAKADNCIKSWLDEPDSALILRHNDANIQYFRDCPTLHKMLFYYTQPSYIKNTTTGTQIYSVANLSLTYNDATNTYAFVVPNKSILLKKTNKPDCMATPLTLDAIRHSVQQTHDRVIRPILNNNVFCY